MFFVFHWTQEPSWSSQLLWSEGPALVVISTEILFCFLFYKRLFISELFLTLTKCKEVELCRCSSAGWSRLRASLQCLPGRFYIFPFSCSDSVPSVCRVAFCTLSLRCVSLHGGKKCFLVDNFSKFKPDFSFLHFCLHLN